MAPKKGALDLDSIAGESTARTEEYAEWLKSQGFKPHMATLNIARHSDVLHAFHADKAAAKEERAAEREERRAEKEAAAAERAANKTAKKATGKAPAKKTTRATKVTNIADAKAKKVVKKTTVKPKAKRAANQPF